LEEGDELQDIREPWMMSKVRVLLFLIGTWVCSSWNWGGGGDGQLANDVKKQIAEGGGGGENGDGVGRKGARAAKAALTKVAVDSWVKYLNPEVDYNTSLWKVTHRDGRHPGQPGRFFAHYINQFSRIFKESGATVNFVLVGACDGTHDKTIAENYLKESHWEGVFVEPVELNFNDLTKYLTEKNVMNRSHIIRAAGTDKCVEPWTKIKFPIYETRSPKAPHWLRREIGAVLTPDEMSGKKKLPQHWKAETVRCMTARDILDDWSNATRPLNTAGARRRPRKEGGGLRRRPHILKIDAEGHDYQVLMGFVRDEVPAHELPLLISFEAKSIRTYFNETVDHLRKRGYVVSDRADDGQITNDGFAMMRGDKIKIRLPKTQRRKQRGGDNNNIQ